MRLVLALLVVAFAAPVLAQPAAQPPKLKVLFLGDNAGHQPAARFKQLQPVLSGRNIELTYTDKLDDLSAKNLANYDGLMIYANHTKITPEQEKALLDYVEGGKGFIPVHCASYCFLNSPKYIDLVGAQFRSHGTGTFRTEAAKADHDIMKGFQSFSSWDETYVHTKHNEKDRTVLEVRAEGDLKEPWTWVRTQGKGRVFYTAWGHDQRTWGHEGFHNLIERGIRWACGQDPAAAGPYFEKPEMTKQRTDVKPFEYVEAKVPFYPPRGAGKRDPITKMQKPLSVEESVKHYVTPVDFEVKTFVTEDKLGGKPIAMNWDEQGRLWLALTTDYPNELQPAGQGRDKIVVCEDTDGDGVCDKVTEFADKLSIPTSLLPYAGGVIVHQAPVTLFLKDTDGDGKADVRQELIRGWRTNDTHAGPSNLHYGFDNWVYGSVGYAGFTGTVAGEPFRFSQGFYRFKLEANPGNKSEPLKVTKLEFLRSTSNNTWGLCFNEAGEVFGSTANGCPIVQMPIPNRYYEKVRGLTPTVLPNIAPDFLFQPATDKVRQVDWHGGFTAASNCAIYTARTYPREYWNRTAFISDPTGHLTGIFTVQPDGGSYKARYGWNLVASDDEWAAPIDAQVGPDGHMWVIDWYAFIVQHNPTPAGFTTGKGAAYETPLRDKTHGRIYRVVYTKAKPEKPFTLKDATPEKLVETLKHPNLTWRLHAQRLLVERGKPDVVPALVKLIEDKSVDETGLNAGAVHAVWTLAGLGTNKDSAAALVAAVQHPSPAVRQAAWRAISSSPDAVNQLLGAAAQETDPRVRLALYMAIADLPATTKPDVLGATLAAGLLGATPPDRATRDAILAAAMPRAGYVLMMATSPNLKPTPEGLAALELIARNYAAGGGDENLGTIIVMLAAKGPHPDVAAGIVNGLAVGWPANKPAKLDADGERAIGQLVAKLPAASRGRLLKLAAGWGVKDLDAQLAEVTKAAFGTVANVKATDAERLAAAQQILEFRPDSDEAAKALVDAVTPQSSPAFATGIFEALATSRAKGLGVAVVDKLKDLPPTARPAALRLVLTRPDSVKAFLDAVEKGTLRFDMLALDQRVALTLHSDKDLADRAKKLLAQGGGLPNADRQKVVEELKPILGMVGDAAAGKKMFTEHCAKCHKHTGEGAHIGPDLTGFAVHPKEEMLIHIIDPSRSVEGNFKAYRVLTADDRTIIGILGAQTANSVEVIDGEAKRHALAKEDIASMKETDKSLMPEGFEKVMTAAQMTDLLEFLSQKGRFVPLPLDKVATIVSTKGMFYDEAAAGERIVFPDWKPKTFKDVPFVLVDPEKDTVKNVVLLHSENGKVSARMPKSVSLPCNTKAKTIHMLGGIGGWAAPYSAEKSVSMIVKLTYEDGKTEEHELKNGVHIADYIGRANVPESTFAFPARQQQVRYLAITPKRPDAVIKTIDLVKGPDRTAPIVVAITVETP